MKPMFIQIIWGNYLKPIDFKGEEQLGLRQQQFAWMFTFSDLLLLLLTTFVMRLSMSNLEPNHIPIPQAASVSVDSEDLKESSQFISSQRERVEKVELYDEIKTALENVLNQELARVSEDYFKPLKIEKTDNVISVIIPVDLVNEGDEGLSLRAVEVVNSLASVLKEKEVQLRVVVTVNTDYEASWANNFASPWHLAERWAVALQRQMIDAGINEASIFALGDVEIGELCRDNLKCSRCVSRLEIIIKENERN